MDISKRKKPHRIKGHLLLSNKKSRQRLVLGSFDLTNLSSTMCSNVSPPSTNMSAYSSHPQTLTSTLEAKWEEAKRIFSSLAYSFNEEESCPRNLQLTFLKYQCHTFISISIVGIEEG